ncbi:MAG TPA: hypothetical protein VNW47_04035 [Terriglobales bacterium]|nr:hypothetical protein [Terriglobales bacterium]
MWRSIFFLLAFASSLSVPANAQDFTSGTASGSTYLLRLERAHYLDSVCVLLKSDGQYHLERHSPSKVRIYEGAAEGGDLREIVSIVSGDPLLSLEQKQVPDMMLTADDDRLSLEIYRSGASQKLHFRDSASRVPFRDALDPLLNWVDLINKRKNSELSEEQGRNNCLPPSTTKFASRTATRPQNVQRAHNANVAHVEIDSLDSPREPYTLLMFEKRMFAYEPHVSCLLVSPSGSFHLVTQSKTYKKGLQNAVLDGKLQPSQLATLQAILDSPDVANQPDENRDGEILMTSDGYETRLFIPRGPATQKLAAWKSYRLVNQVMSTEVEDHGAKTLAPIRDWLKNNINDKVAAATPVPANPRCLPAESTDPAAQPFPSAWSFPPSK